MEEREYRHPALLNGEAKSAGSIRVLIFDTKEELSQNAAEIFTEAANKKVEENGFFTAILSGGKTPKELYEMLAKPEVNKRIPWPEVHLFWGDERCVNLSHPECNYSLFHDSMVARAGVAPENIHPMPAELLEAGAHLYEDEVRDFFMERLNKYIKVPSFDFVLLGLGTDGHTLSLFPESKALGPQPRFVTYVNEEGIEIPERLTMTLPVINNSSLIVFLVSGENKAEILKKTITGAYKPKLYPAQGIRPTDGELVFLVDKEAAKLL